MKNEEKLEIIRVVEKAIQIKEGIIGMCLTNNVNVGNLPKSKISTEDLLSLVLVTEALYDYLDKNTSLKLSSVKRSKTIH